MCLVRQGTVVCLDRHAANSGDTGDRGTVPCLPPCLPYDVYYKVHTLSVSEYYPSPFCVYRSFLTPELETSNSENSATYVLNYNNIEYQNTKYWEILTFEIFVISPQYELVANFYTNLYINIYYDTGECDFEPPV